MTKSTQNKLAWLTPILATLTAILDAGHLAHVIGSEVSVLIVAIATAIVGFVAAMTKPEEEAVSVQIHKAPPPQAAPPPPPAPSPPQPKR